MDDRYYTIMIVPGSRAKLHRIRIRRSLAMGIGGLVLFGLFTAGLLPIIYYKAAERSHEISTLTRENEALRQASHELSALRDQVAYFESKASKFALMAGVEDLPSSAGGGGLREDAPAHSLEAAAQEPDEVIAGEVDNLKERSGVLRQSFELLERVYRDQSLLLSSTPSITPVKGMIAYGFAWRKDPFTGNRAFHKGLDIVAPRGAQIQAPADGIVTRAGREVGYGNVIYLSHGNGLSTRYAHLDGFVAHAGQGVRRGEVIGYLGNTGRSLGAHLHYEVLVNNNKVDPVSYILDDRFTY